ncbi:MAG: transcriptional repressor [Pseudomonadota bacterium]
MTAPKPSPPFQAHDHAICVASAMAAAEKICGERGAQFTPVRRRTLEILLEAHVALGAYDVLAQLETSGFGSKPPVAYRALAFLVEHGFAHRIERLNAFVACTFPHEDHDPAFMICRSCGVVAETRATHDGLDASAANAGFQIEQTVVEAEGLCPICQAPAA